MKAKYQTICIVLSPGSLAHCQVLIEYLSGIDFTEKFDEKTGFIDYEMIEKLTKVENLVIYRSLEINELIDLSVHGQRKPNTFTSNILQGFPNTMPIKLLVLFEYRKLIKIQKNNEYGIFFQLLKSFLDDCYPDLFRSCLFACSGIPSKIKTESQGSVWKNKVLGTFLSIWNDYKILSISNHIIDIRPDDQGKSRKNITRLLKEMQSIPVASLHPEGVTKPIHLVNKAINFTQSINVSSQNVGVLSLLVVFLIWCRTLDYTEELTYIKLGLLLAIAAFTYKFYYEVSDCWSKSSNYIKDCWDSKQVILSRFFKKTDQQVDIIFSSMEKTLSLTHEILSLMGDNLEARNETEQQLKKTLQSTEKQIQKLGFLSGEFIVSSQANLLKSSNNFNQVLTQAQHELKESGKVTRSCMQNIQEGVKSFDSQLGNFFSKTANATEIASTGIADAARAGRLFNQAISTQVKADMKADVRFCTIL